jgi:hypothetical protein
MSGSDARAGGDDAGQQLHHGAGHRQSAKSPSRSLSAFAVVYFKFPFRMAAFWLIFHHADAAGRGTHLSDL